MQKFSVGVFVVASAMLLAACGDTSAPDNVAVVASNENTTAATASNAVTASAPATSDVPSAVSPAPAASPATATGKRDVQCRVTSAGEKGPERYDGTCLFDPDTGGSFSLSRANDAQLVRNITMVSVYVVAPGVAAVSGLTTDGINSRWGEAYRSKSDSACWAGSDFEVCAW